MLRSCNIEFDAASAISQGKRAYQEDAIITDFPIGGDLGVAVLADGMGGHAAGDVASKIAVTEVFSELKLRSGNIDVFAQNAPRVLREAALVANECIKNHCHANKETKGMGTTLLALAFLKSRLFWVSIGDSPLFLFRNNRLRQINEDHSLAPQIDLMVKSGQMTEEEGRYHPERSCLTSVVCGGGIARIDCPENALLLSDGDILVLASDGLQFLSDDVIANILYANQTKNSAEIARILFEALEKQGDPDQDNYTFSVVKVREENKSALKRTPKDKNKLAVVAQHPQHENNLLDLARSALLKLTFFFRGAAYSRKGTQ